MQDGRNQAQVAGDGRLACQQRQHALLDFQVAPVDAVVVGHHHFRERDVLGAYRRQGAPQRIDDEVEPAEHLLLERFEFAMKAVADVGHQPNLPVT